jgi:hypothetical protein
MKWFQHAPRLVVGLSLIIYHNTEEEGSSASDQTGLHHNVSRKRNKVAIIIGKKGHLSEGQEKYLWEPSVTPVGTSQERSENHSCGVSHRTILHGENEVFQSNMNDFPKVGLNLDGI